MANAYLQRRCQSFELATKMATRSPFYGHRFRKRTPTRWNLKKLVVIRLSGLFVQLLQVQLVRWLSFAWAACGLLDRSDVATVRESLAWQLVGVNHHPRSLDGLP